MKKTTRIGSALVVVGSSIATAPASALELGDLTVHSRLGQPLRASIAYALGPNEALADTCVTVQRVRGGNTPYINSGSVSIANGVIALTGSAPVNEPVVSVRVNIRCPYTPRLTRDYMLFVDPPMVQTARIQTPAPNRVVARPAAATPSVAGRPAASREPIALSSEYLVQPGDSLTLIAQRVEDAPGGLMEKADAIFAANPDAFIGNDPNRIMAGSWLTIPGRMADVAPTSYQPVAAKPVAQAPVAPISSVYVPENVEVLQPFEPAVVQAPPIVQPVVEPVVELLDELPAPAVLAPQDQLRPGDIIIEPMAAIPETQLESPQTTAAAPDSSVSIIRQPARQEPEPTNWLLWAGGGLAALIVAILAFGRGLLDRFGSTPIAPSKPRPRPAAEEPVEETLQEPVIGDVDIEIADDSPTAENLALDADLGIGTGLSETGDVDVASDFAFAATTSLDLELTKEMAEDTDEAETDIIPPPSADESSILKSEVLPEDDDYDMSVIVDATKMPDPSDVTERDLEAVAVEDADEALINDDYTVSQEVDYKVLEQDYEDEMTATQMLNEEIQKAAENHAANDTNISPTVSMEAENDTVEMPAKGKKTG